MHRILSIIIIILVSLSATYSQSITGHILESDDKNPIESAHVYLKNTKYQAISDEQGIFQLNDVPDGHYELHCDLLGYAHFMTYIDVDKVLTLDIKLTESAIDMDEIVVCSSSITGGLSSYLTLPGSAHYISSTELKKLNTTDPHQILRNLPGVQIQDEDGFGLRPNIGLRGTGTERSSKITVMEDGILAAPAPYAAPSAYYFPTLGRMHAIEVRKGSGQIQYGPYTTGGMINAISTPIPNEFSGRIKINAGSFDFRNVHASLGNKHKNISYLIEGFQYSSTGFKKLGELNTGFDKKDFIAKVRYESNSQAKIQQSITAKIGESRENSNETYLGLASQDFEQDAFQRYYGSQVDEMNTNHRQLSLTHIIQPIQSLSITTSIYHNTFDRNWYKLDKVKGDDGEKISINDLLNNTEDYQNAYDIVRGQTSLLPDALHVKANNRSYTSQGVQTKLNYILSDQHTIEMGARLHRDEMDRFQWIDQYQMIDRTMELTSPGVHGTESNRIEQASAFSAHILYTFKTDKLIITPGVRLESVTMSRDDYGKEDPNREGTALKYRENKDHVWIPGIGFRYFASEQINLFGGVHRGYAPQGSTTGTEAESSTNYELGVSYQTNELFGSITTYFNNYNNLLGADLASSGGPGDGDLFNGGQVTSWGIESQLAYKYIINENKDIYIPFQMNYTLSQAHFDSDFDSSFEAWGEVESGDELPYLSKHQLNLQSGFNYNKWGLDLKSNYVSSVRITAGQEALNDDNSIDGRILMDIGMTYLISHATTFHLGAQNVFNNKYAVANRPAGYRPGKPRSFTVGIDARF